jgi:histone arginine demethylase JMJD6
VYTQQTFPAIDRRRNLSLAEFRREYLLPQRPVVIEDAVEDWRHHAVFTFAGLRASMADVKVKLFRYDFDVEYRIDNVVQMPFGEFVDKLLTNDWRSFPYYMRDNWRVFHENAELAAAYREPKYFYDWFRLFPKSLRMPYPRLFVGPKDALTPLHADVWGTHAWLTQMAGSKRWLVFSPEQAPLLYGNKVRVENPDYQKHPRFAEARPLECTIKPGDTVFVPSRWAHWVHSLEAGISVTSNYMSYGCIGSCLKGLLREQTVERFKRPASTAQAA